MSYGRGLPKGKNEITIPDGADPFDVRLWESVPSDAFIVSIKVEYVIDPCRKVMERNARMEMSIKAEKNKMSLEMKGGVK